MMTRTLLALAALLLAPAPLLAQEAPPQPEPTAAQGEAEEGAGAEPIAESPSEENADTYRYLNLFGEVFERTRAQYVDEVTDKELIEAALNGMLSELDPHSSYLNAEAFADMSIDATGEFGGLGIQVTMDNGLVKVIAPIDETPAWEAGLEPGDYVVEIDGAPVMGMNLDEAVDLMRGPVGTQVKIRVAREGAEPFEAALTRALIPIHTVRHRVEGGDVGYVRVTRFNQKTAGELAEAIAALREEIPDGPVGYVLDLRANPGGVLEGAVDVADAFLEHGEIVSTRGREIDTATRENARPGDLTGGAPVVVLINAGSASASEIVTGALQDHGRAVVMGTRSFGKGSVQTLMPLGPGSGAMRLTTARYYTPSGRAIQAEGITPDIEAAPARIETLEGEAWREGDLHGALESENEKEGAAPKGAATKSAPETETDGAGARKPNPLEEREAEAAKADYQLARAVDLLHALAIYQNGPRISAEEGAPETAETQDAPEVPEDETPEAGAQ